MSRGAGGEAKREPRARRGEHALPANPRLAALAEYPFARLEAVREGLRARGMEPIDLSLGDPREVTPEFLRRAFLDAVPERSSYPTVLGQPGFRLAAAAWLERRFGVGLDPATQILPASGSKEAIFHFPFVVVDAEGERRRVVYPVPAYPIYERGALLAGGLPTPIPARPERGWLPDLSAVPETVWRETALLWLNYPHNPTGATAPPALFEEALALARRHGFVVASDEAYVEIYFDAPPPSLLESGIERAVAFHSLSKRSAMTGYRSGFVAGDAALIAAYRALRPSLGVASPDFVQAAAEAAWGDETHVERVRESFRRRRDRFLSFLHDKGIEVFPPAGTFFLWVRAPGGDDVGFAERWFEAGVLPLPGSWLGDGGAGYLRVALVAGEAGCREAIRRLDARL